jgi:hypothetical protein
MFFLRIIWVCSMGRGVHGDEERKINSNFTGSVSCFDRIEPLYNKPLKPYSYLAFMINIGSHSSYLPSTRWAAKPHEKAGIDLRGVHRKLIELRGVKAMIAAVALRFPPF